jgi:hypothetical protein
LVAQSSVATFSTASFASQASNNFAKDADPMKISVDALLSDLTVVRGDLRNTDAVVTTRELR